MQKNTPSEVRKPSLPVRFIKWTAFQMISFIFAVLLLGVGYAAWTSLSPSQGASGQPVNQTLVQGIINNINDLDSRVSTLVTNLSTLTTRVVAINPTGTNISTNNLCLSGDCKTAWPSGGGMSQSDSIYYAGACNASKNGQIRLGIGVGNASWPGCLPGQTLSPQGDCITVRIYQCQLLGAFWNWTIQ